MYDKMAVWIFYAGMLYIGIFVDNLKKNILNVISKAPSNSIRKKSAQNLFVVSVVPFFSTVRVLHASGFHPRFSKLEFHI